MKDCIKVDNKEYQFQFVDHILDNVHGHIGLTYVEKMIERTSVFKRLIDISQLGLVNRVFPCALHNRYVHSVGVMYVADCMTQNMKLNSDERQLLRLAGLLHDIGHYPLSHNVEAAYKKYYKYSKSVDRAIEQKKDLKIKVPSVLQKDFDITKNYDLKLSGSKGNHHEAIGAIVIKNNRDIRKCVKDYFVTRKDEKERVWLNQAFKEEGKETYSEDDVERIVSLVLDDIAGIVTGNIQKSSPYFEKYSLFVQIIHSEMDADNIDYLLRDASFSGTTYGLLDMGVLINALRCVKITAPDKKNYYIVGVAPKGVGCVEQFFMNRYLAYSQIVFNKYVCIFESMLTHVMLWLLTNEDSRYNYRNIQKIAKMDDEAQAFLYFTDNYILNFINDLDFNKDPCPPLTRKIIEKLKSYLAYPVCTDKEKVFVGTDYKRMCDEYDESKFSEDISEMNNEIQKSIEDGSELGDELQKKVLGYSFESKKITEQIPSQFFDTIQDQYNSPKLARDKSIARFNYDFDRLANGIPVFKTNEDIVYNYKKRNLLPELIVDSSMSSLKDINKLTYCVIREYDIDNDSH